MRNITLLLFITVFLGCKNEQDENESQRICCGERPYGYGLSLFFAEDGIEEANVLSDNGNEKIIDTEKVYFYYLKNQKKWKILTKSYCYSIKGKLFCSIRSESAYGIYNPFVGEGLMTFYLQKLNNDTDTLQIDIEVKETEKGRSGTRYVMNQFKINGKDAVEGDDCSGDGYCYYLLKP